MMRLLANRRHEEKFEKFAGWGCGMLGLGWIGGASQPDDGADFCA